MLSTLSQLPTSSPLEGIQLATPPASAEQIAALRQSVGLAPVDDLGLVNIRGQEARALFQRAYGGEFQAVGDLIVIPDGIAAYLRPDEVALLTPDVQDALARLQALPSEGLLTLTDISHGRGVILLAGARAAGVLPKVCGLDFADRRFPNPRAAQTMLAKVHALVIRLDMARLPAYYLVIDRSLSAYVWEVVWDAAQEFGGIVLSKETLQSLREDKE
jgi:heterotetrameric sarcosine oxidase gamma subunit